MRNTGDDDEDEEVDVDVETHVVEFCSRHEDNDKDEGELVELHRKEELLLNDWERVWIRFLFNTAWELLLEELDILTKCI